MVHEVPIFYLLYICTVLAGDVSYSNTASTVSESILLSRFDAMRIIAVRWRAGWPAVAKQGSWDKLAE